MAKHVLYDAEVIFNSVDLSDHVKSVEFELTLEGKPGAGMSEAQDYELPGVQAISPITVNFWQDFDATKVYATLSAAQQARTTHTLSVGPTSGAASATNPKFSVSAFVSKLPLVSGERGNEHMSQAEFRAASVLTITVV